jgi:hypothetical protein
MFVRTLYAPDVAIAGPTWQQIEAAIRKLRHPRQCVCLSAHPDGAMTIFQLHAPDYLIVGPRDVYPKHPHRQGPTDRLPLADALRAAHTFFDTGQLDPAIQWWDPATATEGAAA